MPDAVEAVFLDRDGTLIEDAHFVGAVDQVRLLPGVRESLARLRTVGTKLFILTNQSGINRGYFTLADVEAVNRRMLDLLDLGDDLFAGICIAPERPDEPSRYRKPSPRFIDETVSRYGLDRRVTWMIGDRPTDWECGMAARIRVAAILPPTPKPEWDARRVELGVPGYPSLLDWLDETGG